MAQSFVKMANGKILVLGTGASAKALLLGSTAVTGGTGTTGGTGGSGGSTGNPGGATGGGSSNTNPGGNITPGSYSPLTDIAYSQPEPWGKSIAGNGDNYKSISALFGPVGGTGQFTYSLDNATFVSWNIANDLSGSRSLGIAKHGWIVAPGQYPDSVTSINLRIKDALGAVATKTINTFDTSLAAGVSVSAIRTWPNNIAPQIYYAIGDAQGNLQDGNAITLSDPSGLWQIGFGSITPKSGIPPIGNYTMTLQPTGFPSRVITISIIQAQMGGVVALNRASVVSTASPTGWPVLTAAGSSPFNNSVFSINDTSGAYAMDAPTGLLTIADASKLTVGNNYLIITQTEGNISASLTVTIPVTQGTTLAANAMSFAAVRQQMTNDEHNVVLGAPTVNGITNPKWYIGDYTWLNDYAVSQQARYLAGQASDNGTTAQFVIDQNTGQITAPFWVDAGLDGTSTFTYQINVFCTDGSKTCAAVLPVTVSWAPVSRTVYIGRGQKSAHGSDGFEHIADFRSIFVGSDINPHTGTVIVNVLADADPEYYTSDTGINGSAPFFAAGGVGGDYACRFPWPGPIKVIGVAANGVAQPRTGGTYATKQPSGGDMRGKGFWVFGNGQGYIENVEVSNVFGTDATHGIEAVRKDGATYGSLSVIHCNIHDCDQGVETGNWVMGSLLIDGTEIAACGSAHVSSGACHNVYCGQISFAEIKNTVSRHATIGHALKVRAKVSKIHNNRLFDGLAGNGSCVLNIPDGGDSEVYNNIIVKGTMAQVNDALRFGEDLYKGVWLYNNLNFHDNTCDVYTLCGAHWGIPTVVGHLAQTNRNGVKSSVTMANNSVWLAPGVLVWSDYTVNGSQIASTGQTTVTGTTTRTAPLPIDITRPFLSGNLPARGPTYRVSQFGGDSYSNFDNAQQYQDRDQIFIPPSTPVNTTLCLLAASNDPASGVANPWVSGAAPSLTDKPVFYPYGIVAPPAPWRNDLFTVTDNGNGQFALKTKGAVTPGVYYAQVRLTASGGQLSDWRYPVVVTA